MYDGLGCWLVRGGRLIGWPISQILITSAAPCFLDHDFKSSLRLKVNFFLCFMKIEQLDEFSKKKFSSVDLMHDLDGQPHTISHTQSPQSGLFHFWPEFFFSFFINFSLDISLRVNERILWPSAGALIFKTTSLIFSLTLINLCKLLRSFFLLLLLIGGPKKADEFENLINFVIFEAFARETPLSVALCK